MFNINNDNIKISIYDDKPNNRKAKKTSPPRRDSGQR
jgi:hypothetical protein